MFQQVYSKGTGKSKRLVIQTHYLAMWRQLKAMAVKKFISLNEGKKNAGVSKSSANGGENDEPSSNPKKL